jgi:hypothetical protein
MASLISTLLGCSVHFSSALCRQEVVPNYGTGTSRSCSPLHRAGLGEILLLSISAPGSNPAVNHDPRTRNAPAKLK